MLVPFHIAPKMVCMPRSALDLLESELNLTLQLRESPTCYFAADALRVVIGSVGVFQIRAVP